MQKTKIKPMTEKEYRAHDAVNYSSLSKLDYSPKAYKEAKQEETLAMIKGSAVDCLLTDGEDAFHSQYYVMTATKPKSEQMQLYVQSMLENDNRDMAQTMSGYKTTVTDAKWEKEGQPYYDAIKVSSGKSILDYETYAQIKAVVDTLKNNEYTGKYFTEKSNLPEGIEIMYQVPIIFTVKNVADPMVDTVEVDIESKALLDLIVINHNSNTISPKDLKTTGKPVLNFKSSFVYWKYYIQASLYTEGVIQWAMDKYPGYTVEPFEFIVAEMANQNPPMIYRVTDEDLSVGENGGRDLNNNEIKGYRQLMEKLLWHRATNKWDYHSEIYENNGISFLGAFEKSVYLF